MGRDDSKENEKIPSETANDVQEMADLVLFQVKECYVYLIPPRKSAASYRADEWDINKWHWDGALRVVSKGEECSIRLEDRNTGELYALALVRQDYPLPVEAVIDSSRFFVLRIEDTSTNKNARHAFIGLGFRERPEAYDFQAALFDHIKYLNKKKEAKEMEQEYQSRPSMDYSLKEGETLTLQLKTLNSGSGGLGKVGKATDAPPTIETTRTQGLLRAASGGHGIPILIPPPPSPVSSVSTPSPIAASGGLPPEVDLKRESAGDIQHTVKSDHIDEDFGDFQAA